MSPASSWKILFLRIRKFRTLWLSVLRTRIRDEAIKAFIVLNEGETLSEAEFFSFCENNMAKFKVPSFMEIRTDLPRNCSGKIIKKNLK